MIAALSGCSTIENQKRRKGPVPFGGTVVDVACVATGIVDPGGWPAGWFLALVGLIDLPMSLAGDTIMLPHDLFVPVKPRPPVAHFRVMITGTPGFTGRYVHVKDGRTITNNINGRPYSINAGHHGTLRSIMIQRSPAASSWVEVRATQDEKPIFESKRVQTDEPVVFERVPEGAP